MLKRFDRGQAEEMSALRCCLRVWPTICTRTLMNTSAVLVEVIVVEILSTAMMLITMITGW
jgi:hypothetical protein